MGWDHEMSKSFMLVIVLYGQGESGIRSGMMRT